MIFKNFELITIFIQLMKLWLLILEQDYQSHTFTLHYLCIIEFVFNENSIGN